MTSDESRGVTGFPSGEARLAESERVGRVGSWSWHASRDAVEASAELCRILGANGPLGKPRDLARFVHAEDWPAVRAHLDNVRERRLTHATCDFRLTRVDGGVRAVAVRASVSYDADGRPQVAWGTLQDVTERRELEEQLERAQRMEALGQLAGGIAHDFNNLLTVIGVEAELLREGLRRDDPLASGVEAIRKATERAGGLTRQLLAFGRGQLRSQRRLDLNRSVTETVQMLRRLLGEHIELETVLEPQLPPITGDPTRLQQLLVNLAVNARDAMPDGGVLTIATGLAAVGDDGPTRPKGEYVVLTVADTGHGMDESVRRRIFDPFFTTKPPGRGTGLGLATVLGIVERSGGRIAVDSGPGRGTRFTIHLPRADGVEETETRPRPSRRRSEPPARATVLLVEDDPALRTVLERVLREAGHHVLVAEDGYDALAIAQPFAGRIDLVITDVIMPRLGARGMVAWIREARPGVRVLYMSGYAEAELVRRGLLDGETNILEKPFSGPELLEAAREAIRPAG